LAFEAAGFRRTPPIRRNALEAEPKE